jgi:predicted ArsR family transcriptional regulator
LKILNELKRSQGLPVGELADRLKMSYMGVKEQCEHLEKAGLLDTWRQPQTRGRPFKLYRLTQKAHELFPTASNPVTLNLLEAALKLYGPTAPEKLLLVVFQKMTVAYETRLRGETLAERVKWLSRLRDHDGYMSEYETGDQGQLRIVEHHSPILDVLRAYPIAAKLESDMFQRLLGVTVQREESIASGLFSAVFSVG